MNDYCLGKECKNHQNWQLPEWIRQKIIKICSDILLPFWKKLHEDTLWSQKNWKITIGKRLWRSKNWQTSKTEKCRRTFMKISFEIAPLKGKIKEYYCCKKMMRSVNLKTSPKKRTKHTNILSAFHSFFERSYGSKILFRDLLTFSSANHSWTCMQIQQWENKPPKYILRFFYLRSKEMNIGGKQDMKIKEGKNLPFLCVHFISYLT